MNIKQLVINSFFIVFFSSPNLNAQAIMINNPAIQIAAGDKHSIALKEDGSVWTWGDNYYGQLGDGTVISKNRPVKVTTLNNVINIASGYQHNIALKKDGTVWAWGRNIYGNLGDGTTVNKNCPVQVVDLYNIKIIETGDFENLAVKEDGTVYFWGRLGNANDDTNKIIPVQINNLKNIISIAAGHGKLALKHDGTVWSLDNNLKPVNMGVNNIKALFGGGNGSFGIDKNGTLRELTNRTLYPTNYVVNVKMVAVGRWHTLALTEDGKVWAWGDLTYDQFASNRSKTTIPIQVPELINVKSIAAGDFINFAIKNDGTIWAWGNDIMGYLGVRDVIVYTPTQVKSLKNLKSIVAGQYHGHAVTNDDSLYSWGSNNYGQLGDGSSFNKNVIVNITNLTNVKSIEAGVYQSLALKEDGSVWTWGYNIHGLLGNASSSNAIALSPTVISDIENVKTIASGQNHNLALTNDGSLWVWGRIQTEESNFSTIWKPAQLTDLTNVKNIGAGEYYSVALKKDGTIWTWGRNNNGQLGDGTTTFRSKPVMVSDLKNVKMITVGSAHNLALKEDGTLWGWGSNYGGQLGSNDVDFKSTPVQIHGLNNVKLISAGMSHSLALKEDGTIWAWGYNWSGQIGDGTNIDKSTPVQVRNIDNAINIIAGYNNSFAIKEDGTVWAWGHNSHGQLGIGSPTHKPEPCISSLSFKSKNIFTNQPGIIYIYVVKNSSQSATINYTTKNGSAFSGTDYLTSKGTITFEKDETEKFFPVTILNNNSVNTDRTIILSLSDPDGKLFLNDASTAIITISAKNSMHAPYTQTFNTSLPGSEWSYHSSCQSGRIQIVSNKLRMDTFHEGEACLNEAILDIHVNMNYQVFLEFFQMNHDVENTSIPYSFTGHFNGDGVSISDDGNVWYSLVDAEELMTDQTGKMFHIDVNSTVDLIRSNTDESFGLTPDFKFKFQQYGYRNYPTDGREWDSIAVKVDSDYQPLTISNTTITRKILYSNCLNRISINVSPDNSVETYLVEEYIPEGITPDSINESGIWIDQIRSIRWGAFSDNLKRTFTYELTGNHQKNYKISGEASFDGKTVEISGMTDVDIDCSPSTDIKPPDPTGLVIKDVTNNSIDLHWDLIVDPVNVVFDVYRSQTQNGLFYKVNTTPVDIFRMFNGNHFTDTYVKEGYTYYYKIQSLLNRIPCEHFSNTVFAKPTPIEDFQINFIRSSMIINIYGSTYYHFQIIPVEDFFGELNINCMIDSTGLEPVFYLNNQYSGSNVTDFIPGVTGVALMLKIRAKSITKIGKHQFNLRITKENGNYLDYPLFLTVVKDNSYGIYVETEINNIHKGDHVSIFGGIFPPVPNTKIELFLKKPGDDAYALFKTIQTDERGRFEDNELISSLTDLDTYELIASCKDDSGDLHQSNTKRFKIQKGKSLITCVAELRSIPKRGEDFTISGKLFPEVTMPSINLRVIDPDQNINDLSVYTHSEGLYETTRNFFNKKGIWKFKAYWPGNDNYIGCESDFLIIPVEAERGRAIILGGGYASNSNRLWDTTVKLISDAYSDFKTKRFTDDQICLMIHTESIDWNDDKQLDDVVDYSLPNVHDFQHIISNEFSSIIDSETPLFIYMQGHGTRDHRFKVLGDDEFIYDYEIAQSIDSIQNKTDCTIILILESCYSGGFIKELSGLKRVILCSSNDSMYVTEKKGNHSFSRFLFSRLKKGDCIKKAFDFARDKIVVMGYPSPQLDDNGDGISNTESDGQLASTIFLIDEIWSVSPEVKDINHPRMIEDTSSAPISVQVFKGDYSIKKVSAQLIPPDLNLQSSHTTISFPEFILQFNAETSHHEGFIYGLTHPGIYKILVMAQDENNETNYSNVSYISTKGFIEPGDVDTNYRININDAIFALKLVSNSIQIFNSKDQLLADVNGDKKIGLAEIVYILKKESGY